MSARSATVRGPCPMSQTTPEPPGSTIGASPAAASRSWITVVVRVS